MSTEPENPLDFKRFSVRPVPKGWATVCKTCGEGVVSRNVYKVTRWQSRHDCVGAMRAAREAAVTRARVIATDVAGVRAEAERLLAQLAPEPPEVIADRRLVLRWR